MNGNNVLLDTNVVIAILQKRLSTLSTGFNSFAISFITEIELLSYPSITIEEELKLRSLFADVDIIEMNPAIKDQTVSLRKQYKLKLPDAIICATAVYLNIPLLTRDNQLQKIQETNIIHI